MKSSVLKSSKASAPSTSATEPFDGERPSGSRLRALARSVVAPVVDAVAPVVDRAVEAIARVAKGDAAPVHDTNLTPIPAEEPIAPDAPDSGERVTERVPAVHGEAVAAASGGENEIEPEPPTVEMGRSRDEAAPRVAKKRAVRKGLKNARKAHGRKKGRR